MVELCEVLGVQMKNPYGCCICCDMYKLSMIILEVYVHHILIQVQTEMMGMLEEFENNSTPTRVGPGIKIPLEGQSIY